MRSIFMKTRMNFNPVKDWKRLSRHIYSYTIYIYTLCATASSVQHVCCHVNWPTHVTDSVSERMAGQTDIRFLLLQGPPFTSLYILPCGLRHTSVRNIGDEVAKRTLCAQNTHLNWENESVHTSKSRSSESKHIGNTVRVKRKRKREIERARISYFSAIMINIITILIIYFFILFCTSFYV